MSTRQPTLDAGLILETPRLVLRRPTRADAARVADLANDQGLAENLATLPHPYGIDDAIVYIDNTEVTAMRINLGVYLKGERGDDGFIGTVSLMPRDGERSVGYWIGRPYWGHGYATEAARAIVDLAFDEIGVDAVAATARITNGASRRVLEKCGFRSVGPGMGPSLFHRGMVPIERFRLERPIWLSQKNRARDGADVRASA